MPKKGTTNNPNGRPAGVPNKITREIRTTLKDAIAGNIERIQEDLDALKPKERLELLIKLLPYTLPKVEPVDPGYGEPLDAATWF